LKNDMLEWAEFYTIKVEDMESFDRKLGEALLEYGRHSVIVLERGGAA